jgi:hypothetical protein
MLSNDIQSGYLRRSSVESISLKLPEDLLETCDRCARSLVIPRAPNIFAAQSSG